MGNSLHPHGSPQPTEQSRTAMGGLTPIPAARKYPEWNEEGCRELFMSLDSRDFTWESFHRATIRCMDMDMREEVEPLFKDKEGDYKARCPSMQEFIETTLKMPYLGEWEFERQDNMQAYTLNLENRVQLAI